MATGGLGTYPAHGEDARPDISLLCTLPVLQGRTLSAVGVLGEILPNDGAHMVHTMHRDGTRIARNFYRAKVDMPILAVTELAQEGTQGSEVRFHRNHGVVIDKESKKKQHFLRRRGVCFIKLYVPKSNNGTSGFTRPGV